MRTSILTIAALASLAGITACSKASDLLRPSGSPSGPLAFAWPPATHETYPNLQLRDVDGRPFELSSLRGNVILVEPIGMT